MPISAAGLNYDAQRLQQLQTDRDKKADDFKQRNVAPLTQAAQEWRTRLALYADPNDPSKAVAGKEKEYAEAHDKLADTIGQIRQILHPAPNAQPSLIERLGARTLDKLHITRDLTGHLQKKQDAKVGDYKAGTAQEVAADVAGIPYNPLTPDEQHHAAAVAAKVEPSADAAVRAEATTRSQDQAAFDADPNKLPGETLQAWKARQTAKGRLSAAPPKPLTFDSKTGQVIDPKTGQRYSPDAKDNPPEVAQLFDQQKKWLKAQQEFQLKAIIAHGQAYALGRWATPYAVLDTWNGNQPTMEPYSEQRKYPGRFLPAGPGATAVGQENTLEDIKGNSDSMHSAIANLQTDFPEEMRAKIAFAMSNPEPGAIQSLINSNVLGSLTPDQREFLVVANQLKENALALRAVLKAGQGSEDLRKAITDTLPNLLSPDKDFAELQLKYFDATLQRLHRGVPRVPLNNDPLQSNGNQQPSSPSAPAGKNTKDLRSRQHHSTPQVPSKPNGSGNQGDPVDQFLLTLGH